MNCGWSSLFTQELSYTEYEKLGIIRIKNRKFFV